MYGIAEEIQEISLEGFKVVSGEYFHGSYRPNVPLLTLWHTCMSFSKAAIAALNNCERVRIEINSQSKCILVIPVTSADRDGVRWMKMGKTAESRKLDCKDLTMSLFNSWDWMPNHVYRTLGRLVTVDKKLMLLFDFSKPEEWEYKPRKTNDVDA